MTGKFSSLWNPHYPFTDPAHVREIEAVENYVLEYDRQVYAPGDVIESPWGSNQVVEAGEDFCIKSITVYPGFMLSLQRHRGREELWEVVSGVLSVILDGTYLEVPAGQSIFIPQGAVHCMINSSGENVTVRETQRGACREKDNIRLIDFSNRAVYPLTTEAEYKSALWYAKIHGEHVARFDLSNKPDAVWMDEIEKNAGLFKGR